MCCAEERDGLSSFNQVGEKRDLGRGDQCIRLDRGERTGQRVTETHAEIAIFGLTQEDGATIETGQHGSEPSDDI